MAAMLDATLWNEHSDTLNVKEIFNEAGTYDYDSEVTSVSCFRVTEVSW